MSFFDWFRAPAMAHVAPLTSDHASRLAAIHGTAFARAWDVGEFEHMLNDRNIVGDGLFFGSGASLCGFILSRVIVDEAEILTVAIASDARGKGHSRSLLMQHFDALTRKGARVVHLEVEEGNAPALALYRRLGFREIGRRQGYYAKSDGTLATALTMRLEL